jgi:hypothetical protein
MVNISGSCIRSVVLISVLALGSGSIDQTLGRASEGRVYMYAAFGLDAKTWELPYRLQIGDIMPSMGPYVGAGDHFERATFCPAESSMLCFQTSHQYAFAVPKRGVAIGESWAFAGREFLATQLLDYGIAGRRVKAIAIQAYAEGMLTTSFVYACDIGLISIAEFGPNDKHGVNFVLEDSVGFGASPECELSKSLEGRSTPRM